MKDDLLSQLYLDLRADLRDAIMVEYPSTADVKDRFEHLWSTLIEWGATNPEKREAMRQLAVFRGIVTASGLAGKRFGARYRPRVHSFIINR
jgi:hypothetical protein